MSTLRAALEEYLAMRRALGFKLRLAGRLLQRFVDFADQEGATSPSVPTVVRGMASLFGAV